MKLRTILFLLLPAASLFAQGIDTLSYDHMVNLYDNGQQLVAATKFPGEHDALFNVRFTPAQPCSLQGVLLAFSVVKFQPFSGNDTLIVLVYDAQENTQPWFINVVKTYRVNLGDRGFPAPNIEEINPLGVPIRDVLHVQLNPPVPISPKRDMLVAVKLLSRQRMKVGDGEWNGFSLLMKYQIPPPDYSRFRRYHIGDNLDGTKNQLATQNGNVGIWMRPIVKYDPDLPPVILTDLRKPAEPGGFALHANYPNPFNPTTTIAFTLPAEEHVTLRVSDTYGRTVRILIDGTRNAGTHSLSFDGSDLASGVYMLHMESGSFHHTRPMLLMK